MRLVVTGDVDMSSAGELREAGSKAVADDLDVRVDLSGVTFIDSSGVGALVAIRAAALGRERTMVVENPSERARQVIEVCGLTADFGLDDTAAQTE